MHVRLEDEEDDDDGVFSCYSRISRYSAFAMVLSTGSNIQMVDDYLLVA